MTQHLKNCSAVIAFLLAWLALAPAAPAQQAVHHDIFLQVLPAEHRILASDTLTFPENSPREFTFTLHKGLEPYSTTPGAQMKRLALAEKYIPLETYQVSLPPGQKSFTLMYGGEINHPLEAYGKEYARGFRQTPGTVSEQGVYLSGSTAWYPQINGGLLTFTLELQLPGTWEAVSQGKRTQHSKSDTQATIAWAEDSPQEEIFLIAAQFVEYSRKSDRLTAMVFLRQADEKLATQYLDATVQYVQMYEELIGRYPYEKFALVENFWETGFGMPSFTLLGPKVIRFPFILHSSYPHEILHNWWGNSVYPDYEKGNWSEGLTAYLADHLIVELKGQDAEHRQTVLQKYADYVASENDFPLTAFTSRHSSVSEAVGYGKSLMFFHMLRHKLGDDTFRQGLQQFYRFHKFKYASFDTLRQTFEEASGTTLQPFFEEWIAQTGAPQLQINKAGADKENNGYKVKVQLSQEQAGKPYNLKVPVAITLEGSDVAQQLTVELTGKVQEFSIPTATRPLRIDVDPEFDLFRRLHRKEIPPALSMAFGAQKALILLPSAAKPKLLDAYRNLASAFRQSGPEKVEIRLDSDFAELPADQAVVLFGWENRFRPLLEKSLAGYDVEFTETGVRIGATAVPRANHAVVLTALHPASQDLPLAWVATEVPGAAPGLGRKLPHYHKYSYLAFEGEEPTNIAKGRWPVLDSPLTRLLPDKKGATVAVPLAKLAARPPLVSPPPVFSRTAMLETINVLTNDSLQGRGFGSPGLDKAAEYIARRFREAGLLPAGDKPESFFQEWRDTGGSPAQQAVLKNIIGYLPGKNPALGQQSIVIAAHYDHLGLGWPGVPKEAQGMLHRGADDNASGVAVLLELARVLKDASTPDRNVVFIAFAGEEAGKKGSKYYIDHPGRFPIDQTIGMLNIDTVGRLQKGKLLVIGGSSAREWAHIFRGAGYVTGVEVTMVAEDLDSSDQASFHAAGVPAVQLFTGPHLDYHKPTDTADKIDADGLLRVADVAKEAVVYLANRQEFLSVELKRDGKAPQPQEKSARQISLGTMPDFAFQGTGYRLSGVAPGSPAEIAGLQEGDVIIRVGDTEITGMRDLSVILQKLSPGETITVIYKRGEREIAAAITPVAK